MNQILTDEEVGMLTVFDGLHHVETPLLANYIKAIEQAILNKLSEQEPLVPEGYQLVPIEPTESMIAAMQSSGWMLGNYKAMLSAARSE